MAAKRLNGLVAVNLKRFRQKAGFSQEEFAEHRGVHRTYVGSVERGDRNITLDTLQKVAKGLGVNSLQILKP